MDVLVIGAGASGLMAAITAAKNGAKVTLLEKGAKAGRKLAITGNGRCNLTNTKIDEESFRGEHPDFALVLSGSLTCRTRSVSFPPSVSIRKTGITACIPTLTRRPRWCSFSWRRHSAGR